jgi:hypothetical protein
MTGFCLSSPLDRGVGLRRPTPSEGIQTKPVRLTRMTGDSNGKEKPIFKQQETDLQITTSITHDHTLKSVRFKRDEEPASTSAALPAIV